MVHNRILNTNVSSKILDNKSEVFVVSMVEFTDQSVDIRWSTAATTEKNLQDN